MQSYKEFIENLNGVIKVEQILDYSYLIYIEPKEEHEEAIIEMRLAFYDNSKDYTLPKIWHEMQFTDKLFKSVIWVNMCITVKGTKKYGIDPQSKDLKIIFENLREVSEENIKEMVELSIDKYKNQEIDNNTKS